MGCRKTCARFMVETRKMEPLLLVEDKNELRAMLRKALERAGHTVDEAADGTAAIQKVRARRYLLVITDLKMPGASGLDVLRATKQADATIPVILLTAFGSVEEAVTAMKEGAFDFLQKPVDLDHLKLLVQRAARQQELLRENLLLREEYAARYGFPRIVGEHSSIREVSQQIQKVAATDSTVLLLGESGTGKELFARAVHHLSGRREQPFVALNCAAIPEGLVENELFGHERGAFTGEDVLLLANHFLEKFSREFAKPGLELTKEARDRLLHYRWPGNVRELQNTLERAVILADGLSIDANGLQLPATRPDAEHLPGGMLPENFSWEGSLEEVTGRAVGHVERVLLENTLREFKWNKTRAAEKLGVTPKTLLAKLRSAGLEE
jgi:DNA-binding NtrC family response regulator